MVHIIKNKAGKFDVVTTARNGSFLSGSKQGFNRKAGVIKNIRAQMKEFRSSVVVAQDDTLKRPVIMIITPMDIEVTNDQPGRSYQSK